MESCIFEPPTGRIKFKRATPALVYPFARCKKQPCILFIHYSLKTGGGYQQVNFQTIKRPGFSNNDFCYKSVYKNRGV